MLENIDELKQALNDPDPSVAATAAEACCLAGVPELGMPVLIKGLETNTGEEKDPFYSSLETLSWHPSQRTALDNFFPQIEAAGGVFIAVVPEPGTYALMLLGLGLVFARLRRSAADRSQPAG